MKVRCLIIDDEPLAIEVIKEHAKQYDYLEIVQTFNNPIKAFSVLNSEKIDLVFLDINMPQMNGFEFLKNLSSPPLIVITTAYRGFAVKGFELEVFDYLVKPIPFSRFLKTMNRVSQQLNSTDTLGSLQLKQEPHIFLKVNKKLIKVDLNDILFIESLKDYIKVITTTGYHVVYKSLTSISEELPKSAFVRVHRSYTVSINKVIALDGNTLELTGIKIPIGRNYLRQAKEKILNIKLEDVEEER